MERCLVISSRVLELLHQREADKMAAWTVEGSVLLAVLDGELCPAGIFRDDFFGTFNRGGGRRKMFGSIFRLDAIAIVDVEYVVIAEHRNWVIYRQTVFILNDVAARVLLFTVQHLPEYNHLGLCSLLDLAALILTLLEGEILAGLAEQKLVDEAVRLAIAAANCALGNSRPRPVPRNDARFKLRNDAVGNCCENIHQMPLLHAVHNLSNLNAAVEVRFAAVPVVAVAKGFCKTVSNLSTHVLAVVRNLLAKLGCAFAQTNAAFTLIISPFHSVL